MHEKIGKVLDRLIASFESGEVPEALSVAVLPRLAVPCAAWSLCNRLLLFFADTSDARGFRQWQAVKRHPKKGSKAIYILTPRHRRATDEEEDDERRVLAGFVPVPVFRFEDTEGEPIEQPELLPPELPPLFEVAQRWGLQVSWQSHQGDGLGYYQPSTGKIILATHDEKVFFHELAHAAHHRVLGSLKNGQDWRQEVVAELTAATLAHLFSRRTDDGGAYRYIHRYAESAGKDVGSTCLSVVAEVGKCLTLIMQAQEEHLTPEVLM